MSRTEKVLEDLHSGAMFKKMSTSSNSDVQAKQQDIILIKSVVAYLGTVELGKVSIDIIGESSFNTVHRCVQSLRNEQHIHQRVVMMVNT